MVWHSALCFALAVIKARLFWPRKACGSVWPRGKALGLRVSLAPW